MNRIDKVLLILGIMSGIPQSLVAETMKSVGQKGGITVELVAPDKKSKMKITANKLQMAISGKHVRAFGEDRLYKDKLKQDNLKGWSDTVAEVQKFVEKKTDDKVLNNAVADLSKTSDALIEEIKGTYNLLFGSGVIG